MSSYLLFKKVYKALMHVQLPIEKRVDPTLHGTALQAYDCHRVALSRSMRPGIALQVELR